VKNPVSIGALVNGPVHYWMLLANCEMRLQVASAGEESRFYWMLLANCEMRLQVASAGEESRF
jgi:hypothetical protein